MSSIRKIPFIDLKSQYALLRDEIDLVVGDVLAQGSFTLGGVVKRFEEEFASFCGANYAVGVGSGTDALHLALRALGVGPGDEVITVPNTFIATVEAIIMCGARPVFVDIDEDTYLMDVSQLEAKITGNTKAIIPVHLYGQPADMEEILQVAAKYGLKVLEDACQAHGASINGVKTGCLGDAACFSFYPSKNLGGIGDGGMVVTNSSEVYDRIVRLRNHGESLKYNHAEPGFCSRLHGIQAAALSVKLKHLDNWNSARQHAAALYDELFREAPIKTPVRKEENRHVYHLYVVRVAERDKLREHLGSRNIETGIHYPIPLHLQPALNAYGYKKGDFPVCEKTSDEILSLPMFPELEESDVKQVADETVNFLYHNLI